jgi:hypothetical protein
MCAIGCLIEDSYYDPSMEGHTWEEVEEEVKEALDKSGWSEVDDMVFCKAQFIHDDYAYLPSPKPDWETFINNHFDKLDKLIKESKS